MSNGLSYPGLKCVLEFLEANKRIHISSRCPRLQHIERCVPLHLNQLKIRPNVVKLNKITYAIVEREEEITNHPDIELKHGDILIGPERKHPVIEFTSGEDTFVERRVREKEGMQNYEIIRKVLQGLMGGRKNIRVDGLVFERCNSTILRLPSDFKVRIRKLYCGDVNPKYFLPLIDSSSFSLKDLRLIFPRTLDQSIVQTSEKLVILVDEEYSRDHLDDILKLPNKSVITEFQSLSEEVYSSIIDYWLNNKQETGKCFIINGDKIRMMDAAVDLMKKYNGKMVKWNGTEFSSNPDTNFISIPFNDDFVIGIYAVSHREHRNSSHQIVMKTMPIDTFIPAENFSEAKTLIEIEARNPTLIGCLLVSVLCLFFLAVFLFILFVCSLTVYTIFTKFILIVKLFV